MEWEFFASVPDGIILLGLLAAALVLLVLWQTNTRLPPKYEVFAAPGWNRVAEVFQKQVRDEHHLAGGFAVYHKGQLVVECAGGYFDYLAASPWDKTTLTCLFDGTRGIGAIVIAILVDRGLLDYSAPVARYWSEFAANGKESITVEQLLSHQACPFVLDEVYSFFDIFENPSKISHLLATGRPQWKPGSKRAFHSLSMGLYMDQLVRRVDPQHRSLAQFFSEEVAWKFGIDCFIGLPKGENYRCNRLDGFALSASFDYWINPPTFWTGKGDDGPDSNLLNRAEIEKFDLGAAQDNPAFRELPCPSTHGFATATGLAKLYGILANGGRHDNQALLSPSAVEKLNEPLVSGIDAVYSMKSTYAYGRGTIIRKSEDGHNVFGHPGCGGHVGYADPNHEIGWAYISSYPSVFGCDDWKYLELMKMVYETARELERQKNTD